MTDETNRIDAGAPAAEAFGYEAAGTLLGIQAGEAGVYTIPLRLDQRLQRRLIPYAVLGVFVSLVIEAP